MSTANHRSPSWYLSPTLRACALLVLLLAGACADEPSADAIPAPPDDLSPQIPPLEAGNTAEAAVMHWFQAVEKGDFETAAKGMSPADTVGMALRLETYLRPRRERNTTLENVFCPEGADSLICLLAWTHRDQLLLDSVLLLRKGDDWQIHLFPN